MAPITTSHPTKKNVRPSSAAAKLQSHHSFATPLYGNASKLGSTTERPPTSGQGLGSGAASVLGVRPKTQAGGPRSWKTSQPVDHSLEQAKNQRRASVAQVDGIGQGEDDLKVRSIQPNVGSLLKGKIEEKINIDTLEELKQAFESADADNSGQLEQEEFKELLKQQLHIPSSKDAQIDALFQKIDWSSEGSISWDEFCTYMQLEYAEKEDSSKRAKEVAFLLPARTTPMPHREPVLRVNSTSDGTFIACSQDGMITFWSTAMDMKRNRSVVPPEQSVRSKPKWITDFLIMTQYNKIIVGTGDREIQFFELSSFEAYCQISGMETVPLNLAFCATGHDECLILFGDGQGCVNIILIKSVGESLRMWKKAPKVEGIASVQLKVISQSSNVKFIRWQVHDDWVQQLKYYPELRQIISCSNNDNTALVIGCTQGSTHVEQQLKEIKDTGPGGNPDKSKSRAGLNWAAPRTRLPVDQHVFKVYKGVKCFDFCKTMMVLITGGMDRIVRLWNPYVPLKPIGMLRGHNAPIFHLFIASEENRIFSISTDKCIKVWDIQDQTCLLTIRPKSHKIRGDLQACCYSSVSKTLAVATDTMNGLSLKQRPVLHADIVITHKEPIHSVVYNSNLKQIITCSDASVIKLWDFETGNAIFEYGEAHGDAAITCLSLDNTSRRLISGGRDGSIKIWNYNNGHCLRTMKKESGNEEICALTYVEMNKNRYVVAVGWDKKINVYSDATEDDVRHVQHPLPKWGDDEQVGHREDILSVAQCPPNLLATSSYDGEVIVWNLVSGHIFCRLKAPEMGTEDDEYDGDQSISKVLFLAERKYRKDAASLVSSGPRGHVHMWNVFHGGKLLSRFPAVKLPNSCISCMEVDKKNTTLFTSDSSGFIFVWNIKDYCITHSEPEPPELLTTWRGHIEHVTSIVLIEDNKLLMSASLDCTVRLWTYDGEYVGTFGQPDWWDIYNKSTYQHPMVPYDVLVDPQSLPDHPVIDGKHNTQQIINEDTKDKTEKGRPTTPAQLQYGRQQYLVDNETINKQLKLKEYNRGTGKRLRHEKNRPIHKERGGPSEFQLLVCYGLEATPQPDPPVLSHARPDQFGMFPSEETTT